MRVLDDLSIAIKIPALVALSCLAILIVVEVSAARQVRSALIASNEVQLTMAAERRAMALTTTFDAYVADAAALAGQDWMAEGVSSLSKAFGALDHDAGHLRISTVLPVGIATHLDEFRRAERRLLTELVVWDRSVDAPNALYLVDAGGWIVHASGDPERFGRSVLDPALGLSGLSVAARRALRGDGFRVDSFLGPDFGGDNAGSAFVASKVTRPDGTALGAVVFGIGRGQIRSLMNSPSDDVMAATLLDRENRALVGDQRNEESAREVRAQLRAKVPMTIRNVPYVIETRRSMEDVLAPVSELRRAIVLEGAVGLLLVSSISMALARRITQPMSVLGSAIAEVSEGRYAHVLEGLDRRDEIGTIARQLDETRVALMEASVASEEASNKASAFEAAPIPLLTFDANLRISDANHAFRAMVGNQRHVLSRFVPEFDLDVVEGNSISTIWHGAPEAIRKLGAGANSESQRVDFGKLSIAFTVMRLADAGQMEGGGEFVVLVSDETELRRASNLRTALETVHGVVEISTMKRIVRVCEGLARHLGDRPDNLTGHPVEPLLDWDDPGQPDTSLPLTRLQQEGFIYGRVRLGSQGPLHAASLVATHGRNNRLSGAILMIDLRALSVQSNDRAQSSDVLRFESG